MGSLLGFGPRGNCHQHGIVGVQGFQCIPKTMGIGPIQVDQDEVEVMARVKLRFEFLHSELVVVQGDFPGLDHHIAHDAQDRCFAFRQANRDHAQEIRFGLQAHLPSALLGILA